MIGESSWGDVREEELSDGEGEEQDSPPAPAAVALFSGAPPLYEE